mmetsp:Transcript_140988/g.245722  ORF Transcript_140988/g.245722 Transcript_140988/m.245722 type:complete len:221 (-) Transcript_140988:398-1060(-)
MPTPTTSMGTTSLRCWSTSSLLRRGTRLGSRTWPTWPTSRWGWTTSPVNGSTQWPTPRPRTPQQSRMLNLRLATNLNRRSPYRSSTASGRSCSIGAQRSRGTWTPSSGSGTTTTTGWAPRWTLPRAWRSTARRGIVPTPRPCSTSGTCTKMVLGFRRTTTSPNGTTTRLDPSQTKRGPQCRLRYYTCMHACTSLLGQRTGSGPYVDTMWRTSVWRSWLVC